MGIKSVVKVVLVLIALVHPLKIKAGLLIISDIDDTIRTSDVVDKINAGIRLLGNPEPYKDLHLLFNLAHMRAQELNQKFAIRYVSASYAFMYDAREWLEEFRFPLGRAYQKHWGEKTEDYKKDRIRHILDSLESQSDVIWFFGDNADKDPKIYMDIIKERGLTNAKVFIRDVRVERTVHGAPQPHGNLVFFFTASDLMVDGQVQEFQEQMKPPMLKWLRNRTLVPSYLVKRLSDRLGNVGENRAWMHIQKRVVAGFNQPNPFLLAAQ